MAVTITADDIVNDDFDYTISDDLVAASITVVDQADDCLDNNDVSEAMQKLLKVLGARHFLSMQINGGRGVVKSESAPSGASRSFSFSGGSDTAYLQTLKSIDAYGCVSGLFENTEKIFLDVVG